MAQDSNGNEWPTEKAAESADKLQEALDAAHDAKK